MHFAVMVEKAASRLEAEQAAADHRRAKTLPSCRAGRRAEKHFKLCCGLQIFDDGEGNVEAGFGADRKVAHRRAVLDNYDVDHFIAGVARPEVGQLASLVRRDVIGELVAEQ